MTAAAPFYAPDFAVRISGVTLTADVSQAVRRVTCETSLDTAAMFTLELNNAGLELTDSPLFDVGKEVEIHLGYTGDLRSMLLGEITSVSPTFPESGAPTLTVTGYDKSHRMRHNRPPSRTFKYENDSLIAAQIAAENLLVPVVDPAPTPRRSVTQTGSDWELLSELAERNAFQLYVDRDELHFHFPRPQTEQVLLQWGANLAGFAPRLSTSGQVGVQVVRGYDQELAQTIVAVLPLLSLDTDLDALAERLGSGIVDQLARLGRHVVRGRPVSSFFDAAALAKAMLQQIQEGLFEGTGSCIGLPALRAGDTVAIRGVGRRFSGTYLLSQVRHTIDEGGFRTEFDTTQRWTSTLLQSLRGKLSDTQSAAPRQPPVHGVWVATVTQTVDPDGLGRIQVNFPELSDGDDSTWARIATFAASGQGNGTAGWGGYFLPNRGDEVLVAFEHGDVDRPVVIGALWNRKSPPPVRNNAPAAVGGITTKTGMQLLFDETAGAEKLVLRDKAGATVTLDSTSGKENLVVRLGTTSGEMRIEHPAGSSIVMAGDGTVTITAAKGLRLVAEQGEVSVDAPNVTVTVDGAMDVS
jgi:phage protein D